MEYNLLEYLCLFFCYGFLGWCAEVIFAAARQACFVNRGFLFGPICPIYGLGMLAVLIALEPLKENLIVLYIGSVVITTLLELVVGVLAEKLLHQRLWDYSDMRFNFKGYISLLFSLIWGLGAMFIVCVLHPVLLKGLRLVPETVRLVLTSGFTALLLVDCVLTLMEAVKIPRRLRALQEMERLITEMSENIGENLADGTIKMRDKQERAEKLREEAKEKFAEYRRLFDERSADIASWRLMKAFPHLNRSNYRERLERVRKRYEEFMDARRKGRK